MAYVFLLPKSRRGDFFFFFSDTLTCFIKEVNVEEESAFPSKLVALELWALR